MHYGRIIVIVGALVGAIGFIPQSATTAGEEMLPALNEATAGVVPAGLDSTYTALYNDTAAAAIIYAIAILAAFATAVIPPFSQPMKRLMGLAATVIGVLMLVIGVLSTMGAMDDASDLEGAFAQAGQTFTVSIGWGWWALILGGVIVAIGGVLSLIARPDEDALAEGA